MVNFVACDSPSQLLGMAVPMFLFLKLNSGCGFHIANGVRLLHMTVAMQVYIESVVLSFA